MGGSEFSSSLNVFEVLADLSSRERQLKECVNRVERCGKRNRVLTCFLVWGVRTPCPCTQGAFFQDLARSGEEPLYLRDYNAPVG